MKTRDTDNNPPLKINTIEIVKILQDLLYGMRLFCNDDWKSDITPKSLINAAWFTLWYQIECDEFTYAEMDKICHFLRDAMDGANRQFMVCLSTAQSLATEILADMPIPYVIVVKNKDCEDGLCEDCEACDGFYDSLIPDEYCDRCGSVECVCDDKLVDDKLVDALAVVYFEARKQADFHKKKLGESPLKGWLFVDHVNYHVDQLGRATHAADWCLFQRAENNPDEHVFEKLIDDAIADDDSVVLSHPADDCCPGCGGFMGCDCDDKLVDDDIHPVKKFSLPIENANELVLVVASFVRDLERDGFITFTDDEQCPRCGAYVGCDCDD